MGWEDKPLKKQGYNSVPQRFNLDIDDWEVETTEADLVSDTDVLAKLQELDTKVQGIIDGTTPANTQLTGSNAEQTITYQRSGVMTAGTSETLVDIAGKEINLQSLSLGTDYSATQLRISFYREDGTLDGNLRIANSRGTSLPHPSPLIVENESLGENDFWKVQMFNQTDNQYVLTMKRPLVALNGLKLTIHNFDTVDQNVAINSAIATWA